MALSRRREALLGRLGRRRDREREGLFLVEGVRACADALELGVETRFALRAPGLLDTGAGAALARRLDAAGVEVVEVDDATLAAVADTETPQGVLLVCAEPGWSLDALEPASGDRPRLLVLDAVQDPGNAGTLVRAAAAFGMDGVVALDGTVDLWGAKAVRASAGGVFRTRVVHAPWDDASAWLARSGLPLLVADAGGEDVAGVAPGRGWALAVGNEGAGPRAELVERAERVVRIPMPGDAESLNAGVAGSILLYVLTRAGGGAPGPARPHDPAGGAS